MWKVQLWSRLSPGENAAGASGFPSNLPLPPSLVSMHPPPSPPLPSAGNISSQHPVHLTGRTQSRSPVFTGPAHPWIDPRGAHTCPLHTSHTAHLHSCRVEIHETLRDGVGWAGGGGCWGFRVGEWQLPRKVGSEKRKGLRPSHRFVLFLSLPVGQLYVRDCWRVCVCVCGDRHTERIQQVRTK